MIEQLTLWFIKTLSIPIVVLSVVSFYTCSAFVEAWGFRATSRAGIRPPKLQHWFLQGLRIPFWLLILLVSESLAIMAGCIVVFPFIHDGLYYYLRNRWNPAIYRDGFKSDPDKRDSNAKIDLSWNQRKLWGIIGVILILIGLISNKL